MCCNLLSTYDVITIMEFPSLHMIFTQLLFIFQFHSASHMAMITVLTISSTSGWSNCIFTGGNHNRLENYKVSLKKMMAE